MTGFVDGTRPERQRGVKDALRFLAWSPEQIKLPFIETEDWKKQLFVGGIQRRDQGFNCVEFQMPTRYPNEET